MPSSISTLGLPPMAASSAPGLSSSSLSSSSSSSSSSFKASSPPLKRQRDNLTFSSSSVKNLSHSRRLKPHPTILPDLAQKDQHLTYKHLPFNETDAERHANLFLAYIQENENSCADLSITNLNPVSDGERVEGCPPWDFAWTDGYVLSKDVPPTKSIKPHPDVNGFKIMDQESELKGCDCEDDECDPKTCACLRKAMTLNWSGNYHEFMDFAYDENGCIQSWFLIGAPIWECNSKCGCSSSCRNRVVQKGRTQPLDIFKTPNFGWGIRARETIPQGAFIGIYAGELITEKESDHRAAIYDQIGSTYQFNLDNHIIKQFRSRVLAQEIWAEQGILGFVSEKDLQEKMRVMEDNVARLERERYIDETLSRKEEKAKRSGKWNEGLERQFVEVRRKSFEQVSRLNKDERQEASVWERRLEQMEEGGELVIDAGLWGNLTRFLNHSCDPNLFMYPVWTEEPSIYRPFLAFFSRRVIEAGEELTFDYKGGATEDDEEEDPLLRDEEEEEDKRKAEEELMNTDGAQEVHKGKVQAMKCLCGAFNCRKTVFK